jgi:hypothetical protein
MSRKTRRRQSSAATSCYRIEVRPSRRVAVACACWLVLALFVVLDANVSWLVRAVLTALLTSTMHSVSRFILLRGCRGVRVVEWDAQGEFHLGLGPGRRRVAASLLGSQRLGLVLWTLQFHTAEGRFGLMIDTALQPRRPLRRLGRALERGDLIPSRPKV